MHTIELLFQLEPSIAQVFQKESLTDFSVDDICFMYNDEDYHIDFAQQDYKILVPFQDDKVFLSWRGKEVTIHNESERQDQLNCIVEQSKDLTSWSSIALYLAETIDAKASGFLLKGVRLGSNEQNVSPEILKAINIEL